MRGLLAQAIEWLCGWLLNVCYLCLVIAVSPVLIYRSIRYGKYRDGWSQKLFGHLPSLDAPRTSRYWLHAVSVGEVLLLEPILDELLKRDPSAEIVISSTTSTGFAVACERFTNRDNGGTNVVCYFPLDFTWAVSRSLKRIRPTHVVLVELELWPNFIMATKRIGVSLQLINARLSQKSFFGYSRLRWLMRHLLDRFDGLAVQNEEYAARLIDLGADPCRVNVTGSVKFDRVECNRENGKTQALRLAFGISPHERVFIAGSTQDPEERIAIEAWQEARQSDPSLRLILVPRHKERFDDVARLVRSFDLELIRRSEHSPFNPASPCVSEIPIRKQRPEPVILLDTLGELSACWGLADFAFVGGSLTNRGGQNMIEPAAFGAAVCFGPNTRNFRDTVEQLLSREAARVVQSQHELAELLIEWLNDPDAATQQGRRAQQFVESQHGASQHTVSAILGEQPAVSQKAA